MTTVEWTSDEKSQLENLGYDLNFKGFFIKNEITLSKRLDPEFNELYYSAHHVKNGLVANVPAYRVDDGFISFYNEVVKLSESGGIFDMEQLVKWLNINKIEYFLQDQDGKTEITFNKEKYLVDTLDIEKTVLYLTINLLLT